MYITIDKKPKNSCEIQNSACGKSGVMLRLKIVKHIENKDLHMIEGANALPHGTSVLKFLGYKVVEVFVLIRTLYRWLLPRL